MSSFIIEGGHFLKGKINFFVIHENKDTFQKYVNYIKNHENCNSITIFEFENDNLIYYPNLIHDNIKSINIFFCIYINGSNRICKRNSGFYIFNQS